MFWKKPVAKKLLRPTAEMPQETVGNTDVILEVTNVGKRYGDFWAVREVSMVLRKGQSLGIIGLNGAGKSTLLKIIAGSIPPTEGDVKLAGRVVALLDLSAGFNEDFTGIENLHLSAAILGLPRGMIDEHLTEIEDFAEIGDFIHKPLRTYSTGMRVRLAFALLTQVRPDLMIIDEVLSVGDAYFAHKCARLLRQFRDEGRSLLFVSHDPSAVKTYCDHAVLLDKGRLIRSGVPSDIIDYYNAMIAAKEAENEIRVSAGAGGRRTTRSGSQLATLSKFDLTGEDGKSVRAILCGTTVRLVCGIDFNGNVASPTVGFVFRDRLGNDVFGTNTYYLGLKTGTYQAGESMEVVFTVPLDIGPGSYSCSLAVHAGADHREGNYDWRDNVLAITVLANWPFQFVGSAALRVSVGLAAGAQLPLRDIALDGEIDFSENGNARPYLMSGWCVPERTHCWTDGKKACIAVTIPRCVDLLISAEVFSYAEAGQQHVQFGCMDTVIQEWTVSGAAVIQAKVPAGLQPASGKLRLWWNLPDARSPKSLGLNGDPREIGLAFKRITFSPLIET